MPAYWSLEEPANLGEMTALPRNGRWESRTRGIHTNAIVNETTGGKRYGNKLFRRRLLPGIIFEFPRELAAQYEAIIEATDGPVRDFWFTIDGNFDNVMNIRLDDDRYEPEIAFAANYNGTVQQWFSWTMRASEEVTPVEVF
jgi:hypothetical protein